MQIEIDFSSFVRDLDTDRAARWLHGAECALSAVRDITSSTWALAEAMAEMLWAGGDKRLHLFWKEHLRGVLTLKVGKRLVRLWEAFKLHPDRDMLGPDVWAFIHHDLSESEMADVEAMAKSGASPEELRQKLDELGQAAADRRAAAPTNEDDIKSVVRRFLEAQGYKVEGERILRNARRCDLKTPDHVVEVKGALTLQNWDKAIGQLESYYWCEPACARVLAFGDAAPELQLLMRQAIDNGFALLRVDVVNGDCEWLR
jgi:hypothetical protein